MDSIFVGIAAGAVGIVAAALLNMRVFKQPQGNDKDPMSPSQFIFNVKRPTNSNKHNKRTFK